MADWNAETSIQIGDPEGPPWPHLGTFLDGFAAGVLARGAHSVTVVSSRAGVRFRFEAPPARTFVRRIVKWWRRRDDSATRSESQRP